MEKEKFVGKDSSQALAGVFQQITEDCKSLHPIVDEVVQASMKLQLELKSTIGCFAVFLESLDKISEKAVNTKGSSRDIGKCLKNIYIEHKSIQEQLQIFNEVINEKFIAAVQNHNNELKKKVVDSDRIHWKELRKMKTSIKRKKAEISKLKKKTKKDKTTHLANLKDILTNELRNELNILEQQEKQAVRRIQMAERQFYCKFASCLQLVMAEELKIFGHSMNISQELLKLDKMTENPEVLPASTEVFLNDLMMSGHGYIFITPPSSPRNSLLKSWGGSIMSIASLKDSSPTSATDSTKLHNKKAKNTKISNMSEKRYTNRDADDNEMSFKSALGRNTLKSNFGHGTEMEDLLEEEPETYFTRPSPPSSGYGSSPPKFNHSEEDQAKDVFNFEKSIVSPSQLKRQSVMSSFKESPKIPTFYEKKYNTLPVQVNDIYDSKQSIGRSLSFGSNYEEGQRYKKHPETGRPRRNSEVATNVEDDIRILEEEKNSIMNLMNEFGIDYDYFSSN